MLPCVPPEDDGVHRGRFRNDIRPTGGYLEAALSACPKDKRMAVALILPKIDPDFSESR